MLKRTLTVVTLLLFLFGFSTATSLTLRVTEVEKAQYDKMLDPSSPFWNDFTQQELKFHRTPPLYKGDPVDDGFRPRGFVQIVRTGKQTLVKISWLDVTENATGKGKRYPDAGEDHVYKVHSTNVSGFPDAVCLQIPKARGVHEINPSLIMGEKDKPVDLYYWKSGEGFSQMEAEGRSTTTKIEDAKISGKATKTDSGWSVVISFDDLTQGTPISFACWDGSKEHRDGIKYFSLWYELE